MDPTTGYFKDIYEYYNDNVYLPEHNLSYTHNEILEDLRPEPQHEEGNVQNYWDIWNVRNEEKELYELFTQNDFNNQWQNEWNNLSQKEQKELEELIVTNKEKEETPLITETEEKLENELSSKNESPDQSEESTEESNNDNYTSYDSENDSLYEFPTQKQIEERQHKRYTWTNYRTKEEIVKEYNRVCYKNKKYEKYEKKQKPQTTSNEKLNQQIHDILGIVLQNPKPDISQKIKKKGFTPSNLLKKRVFEILNEQNWENTRKPQMIDVSKEISKIWNNKQEDPRVKKVKQIYCRNVKKWKQENEALSGNIIKRQKIEPTILTQEFKEIQN